MERRGMKNKGLSPVIATVLLVGLVVVTGIIIFTWFRGLTQEAVTKFDQNIQLTCNNVKFEARYSSSDGELAISNQGEIPIYGIKMKVLESSGDYNTVDLTEETGWPASGLGQCDAVSMPQSLSGKTITLIPVLVGTDQSGTRTQVTCDETSTGVVK